MVTFAFAQHAISPGEVGIITSGSGARVKKELAKKLNPTQVKVLSALDSVRNVFLADVEKNKEVINTFNVLMQRSTALGEQQKQAYDLIMDALGYDPKKYKVVGYDLKRGELTVLESK